MKRLLSYFLAIIFLFFFSNFAKAEKLINIYIEGKIKESNSYSISVNYYNLVAVTYRNYNSIFKSFILPTSLLILHQTPSNLSIPKGAGIIIKLPCEEKDIESPELLTALLLKSLPKIDLADKKIVKIITDFKVTIRLKARVVDAPYQDLTSVWYDSFELLQTEPLFEPFVFLFNIEYPTPTNLKKIPPDSIIIVTLTYDWKKIRLAELPTILSTKLLIDINLSDTQRVKIIRPSKNN